MTPRIKNYLVIFALVFSFCGGVYLLENGLENAFYAQISKPFYNIPEIKLPPPKPKLDLQAKSAVSLSIDKNGKKRILYQKDIQKVLPIASLSKLMTALVIFDNPDKYDLKNGIVIISKKAASQTNIPVYGNLDKEIGEKLKISRLLDLMLIYSSNDAAFALSEVMGTKNFVKEMNRKASLLGLENTYFVNPTGLDPGNIHYSLETKNFFNHSTAKDLARLTEYILENYPEILNITKKNHLYKIKNGIFDLFLTEEILGGKTGYTKEAGGCIIFVFRDKKKNTIINVLLGASDHLSRIKEMQKLINWLLQ